MIEILSKDRSILIDEAKIACVYATPDILTIAFEQGRESDLHFSKSEGDDLDGMFAMLRIAMGTNKNKFRYTGKKD